MSFIVAIIGMPNVGKSTLFNLIVKNAGMKNLPLAIIDKIPGVTRDRNYQEVQWKDKKFTIIDTGGLFFEEKGLEDINTQVREQAFIAIQEADLILHLVDGKAGFNPYDKEIVDYLRESGKNFLVVVNKVDSPMIKERITEFYTLAPEILPLSAITGYGFEDLMSRLISYLSDSKVINQEQTEKKDVFIPKVAVVGRPNVGKSTLINSLLNKRRLIVSPFPGTTRDAIDTYCYYYGEKYLFIDTAGLRKDLGRNFYKGSFIQRYKSTERNFVERLAILKTLKSIQRSDIALIVLDAAEGVTSQDQKIAGLVAEAGKGIILLLNKWDLIDTPENTYKKIKETLKRKMWFADYAPVVTVSALYKKRLTKIFPLIKEIFNARRKIFSSEEMQSLLIDISTSLKESVPQSKNLKFLNIKQIDVEPPAFEILTNHQLLNKNHLRFIEKIIRKRFSLAGTPIRIFLKYS